jgi:Pentapeptide repeats (8 copies)
VLADSEHVEVLRRGPRSWNDWRRQNPATVPNLIRISLSAAERQMGVMNGGPVNVASAGLRGSSLRFVMLAGANLAGADPSGADLTDARLDGANLHQCRFEPGLAVECRPPAACQRPPQNPRPIKDETGRWQAEGHSSEPASEIWGLLTRNRVLNRRGGSKGARNVRVFW